MQYQKKAMTPTNRANSMARTTRSPKASQRFSAIDAKTLRTVLGLIAPQSTSIKMQAVATRRGVPNRNVRILFMSVILSLFKFEELYESSFTLLKAKKDSIECRIHFIDWNPAGV
jgi:hypothetical protein